MNLSLWFLSCSTGLFIFRLVRRFLIDEVAIVVFKLSFPARFAFWTSLSWRRLCNSA